MPPIKAMTSSGTSTTPESGESSAAAQCSCGSAARARDRIDPAHIDAVRLRAAAQCLERGQFRSVGGHHELAATTMRHAALRTVGVQQVAPAPAQARLERAPRVVQPGVDHARIAAGHPLAGALGLFQHEHRLPGAGAGLGHGQTHNARPDHHEINVELRRHPLHSVPSGLATIARRAPMEGASLHRVNL
jgi:hypothetical protein